MESRIALGLSVFLAVAGLARAETTRIKLATLAPEGSVWMRVLRRGGVELRKRTAGRVALKIYPGGVAGDEADVVRKMRLGQLQAAGITGFGLSEILPDIHVLELPLLFRDGREVDAVLEATVPFFAERFIEKGFRLLGVTETGFVHLYSSVPVHRLEEYQNPDLRVWTWQGDRIPATLFAALRAHMVPLGVPDVLTGLQTGMINVVNGPPAAIVALQWHTRVNYMTPEPYWWTSGGIVLTEQCWSRLSEEDRRSVAEVLGNVALELRVQARRENERAFQALQKRGIELLPPLSPEERDRLEQIALRVKNRLLGDLYSQEVLDVVDRARTAFRSREAEP